MSQDTNNNAPAVEMDNSVDAAASALTGILREEMANDPPSQERVERDREPDGRFKAAQQQDAPKVEAAKDGEVIPPDGEDEDYFEMEEAGDDGKPVVSRYKASEVWEGFRKAKELETQLTTVQREQPLPEEIEATLVELTSERSRYMEALQQWAQYNQPKMPPREMRDPNHPNYNPEEYVRLMGEFERAQHAQSVAQQEMSAVRERYEEEQKVLNRAKHARERAKLLEVWPEMKEKAVADKAMADLEKLYRLDAKTVESVLDHRFFALAKDALAFRQQQAAKQEAVKTVRAKPKLVRAQARSTTNQRASQFKDSFERAAKSGSLDDAADALNGLLN